MWFKKSKINDKHKNKKHTDKYKTELLNKDLDLVAGGFVTDFESQALADGRKIPVLTSTGFCECFSNNVWAKREEFLIEASIDNSKNIYYDIKCYNCGKHKDIYVVER